ncbi:MAG: hypothetical protein ACSHYA_18675 [Opitutaceae bacterium]
MKLQQGQVWKTDPEVHSNAGNSLYLRIVLLERLAVEYKEMSDLVNRDGKHKSATKKEFCRLIKRAEMVETSA